MWKKIVIGSLIAILGAGILEDDEAQAGLSASTLTLCIKRNYQCAVLIGAPSRTHSSPEIIMISGLYDSDGVFPIIRAQ